MKAEAFTVASSVFQSLETVFDQCQLRGIEAGAWTPDQCHKCNEIVFAWYCTVLYYSRQGHAIDPPITGELDSLRPSAGSSSVSQDTATEQSTGASRADVSTEDVLELTRLLARAPVGR